jgi:hypothetical protein
MLWEPEQPIEYNDSYLGSISAMGEILLWSVRSEDYKLTPWDVKLIRHVLWYPG